MVKERCSETVNGMRALLRVSDDEGLFLIGH